MHSLLRWGVILLVAGWWVVRGYGSPPDLVAGPYASFGDCQDMALQLNQVELTSVYHCEYH